MKQIAKQHLIKMKENSQLINFNFSFPSFYISPEVYENSLLDLLIEKIRAGLDENKYGNKAFNVNSNTFLNVERKVNNGSTLGYQEQYMHSYISNYLPLQIEEDKSLNGIELSRLALYSSVSNRVEDSFISIAFKKMVNDENIAEINLEIKNDINNLSSTLFMIQKRLPLIYNQMLPNLKSHDLFNEIESQIKKPSQEMISTIYEHDPSLVSFEFPLHLDLIKKKGRPALKKE